MEFFEGIELPFTLAEVLDVSMMLLGVVSAFILIGMAFLYVPKWIALAFNAISGNSPDGPGVKRDAEGNRIHFQSREAREYRDNFYKEKGWKV